jgi:hypothetical protein
LRDIHRRVSFPDNALLCPWRTWPQSDSAAAML